MIDVRIEEKPAFTACGASTRITGQDNAQFAKFWNACNENGVTDALKRASSDPARNVTGAKILGVSRVENDPQNRAFDFYIAAETDNAPGFTRFSVAAGKWAVFTGDGDDAMALVRAEMHAFDQWLPSSQYVHDLRPELEVYPERPGVYVEFWLPICDRLEA